MENEDYLIEIHSPSEIEPGTIVRRVGEEKCQQGGFVKPSDDASGFILINVVDLENISFVAEAGIVRPAEGETVYRHSSNFRSSPKAPAAREILTNWALFGKHPALQSEMLAFVESCYSPEQIMHLKSTDNLQYLFIPLQQRFKIGKFEEKIDWDKVLFQTFKKHLDQLEDEKHITYVAFIPRHSTHIPKFYSIGTKPHLETLANLKREGFAFRPNQGGHIKIISGRDEKPRRFLVDAGSNDLGAGIHTSQAIAELVTESLLKLYPDAEYIPVAGRGAHGIHQSY